MSLEGDGLPGVLAYRTRKEVFGVERTVVVTYNENLFVAQSRTLLREIAKRQRALRELQHQLRRRRSGTVRRGKPPTVAGVSKKVAILLKARHMKDLFHVEVAEQDGLPTLTYRFDRRAWERLQKTLLGKTILFTDNDDWTDADIVRGYRAQHHVENAFRDMKDPHHIFKETTTITHGCRHFVPQRGCPAIGPLEEPLCLPSNCSGDPDSLLASSSTADAPSSNTPGRRARARTPRCLLRRLSLG